MFIGGLLASTGYALAPVTTSEKILYISSISAADDLTQHQGKIPISSAPAELFAAHACDWQMGLRAGLQECGFGRGGLCLRLRAARGLSKSV